MKIEIDLELLLADYDRLSDEATRNAAMGWSPSPVEDWKNNIVVCAENLKNFRADWVSRGTLNYPDRPRNFPVSMEAGPYQPDPWISRWRGELIRFRTLKRIVRCLKPGDWPEFTRLAHDDGEFGGRTVWYPLIGRVSEASLRYAYYAITLSKLLPRRGTVMEIGAGYGGLCERLFPLRSPRQYLITDLPLNMMLIYLNLLTRFGEKVGRYWFRDQPEEKSRPILIVAPWLLYDLETSLNLAINTMSFQHMSLRNLEYYGEVMKQFNTQKLYSVNRKVKRDPTDVVANEYPFRSAFNKVERRISAIGPQFGEEIFEYQPKLNNDICNI